MADTWGTKLSDVKVRNAKEPGLYGDGLGSMAPGIRS